MRGVLPIFNLCGRRCHRRQPEFKRILPAFRHIPVRFAPTRFATIAASLTIGVEEAR